MCQVGGYDDDVPIYQSRQWSLGFSVSTGVFGAPWKGWHIWTGILIQVQLVFLGVMMFPLSGWNFEWYQVFATPLSVLRFFWKAKFYGYVHAPKEWVKISIDVLFMKKKLTLLKCCCFFLLRGFPTKNKSIVWVGSSWWPEETAEKAGHCWIWLRNLVFVDYTG